LVGFLPISHMGHAEDLGSAMEKLPGKKHIGISSKSDLFSPKEKSDIMKRQWGQADVQLHIASSGGEVIAKAHASLPKTGKKALHILVGADRVDFANGLKRSLEADKIKEMEGKKFDEIDIYTPEDTKRTHGMSGTKMRMAALDDKLDAIKEFQRHLGNMFSKDEVLKIKNRIKSGITSGKIKVKR